ncbi:putative MFS family arabinose efflux permease [Virgibacillus natechei]|uniref:MFS family arabinose efflux permease n=1 Tax=Virgibacillus natechei TaxID=1216297 RepID=A0ABS4IKR3_9BACI|nr:MFS transporter [Virgibacillus natechei]MBP1971521.1 putative MFS family arabinose efflux permease [Virgibacillus natechei]UZD12008.1 MFS transporter [Virgibacillus natechei]
MSFFSLYALEREFTQVGLFFFLIAVASFVVRIVSGKLFDKYGPTIIIILGSLFSIVGLLLLYVAASDVMLLTAAVFYGFGFGAILPAIQTWCLNLVGEHEHEDATATFFNFFDLGIGGGSLILGLAVVATDSYQVIYIIAMLIYVVLLVIYMVHLIVKRKSVKYGGNNVQTNN